jgi:membrane-associated phospholipid phosphatase
MRIRQQIAGAAVSFGALAILAAQAGDGGGLARTDRVLFDGIQARRGTTGIAIAKGLSTLAEPAVIYPMLGLAGVASVPRTGWRYAWVPCLVVASGAVARRRASQLIARPRPPAVSWLTTPEGYSLPSKHTTLAALTAGACMSALGISRPGALAVRLAAATGVGASRVYLGVHWPADVVAGWLFADGWLRLADSLTDSLS